MLIDVNGITLRTFVPEDASRIVELQRRSLAACTDISLLPECFYLAPGFAGGQNILCAVDASGAHLGHAMLFPNGVHRRLKALMLWLDLRVDPELENRDVLRDLLLERMTARARQVQQADGGPAMLYATYFESGEASIGYLKSRGFTHFESMVQMRRNLHHPIPVVPKPEGLEIRSWQLETEQEQRRYLAASEAAFGTEERSLEDLQHFLRSDLWAGGTAFTAFDGNRVVGSVMAYLDPNPADDGGRVGLTEYVFVRPEWRRRGVARYLLAESLAYLKAREVDYASLEVLVENVNARSLYEDLGYTRLRAEISLGLWLQQRGAV
jgi:ribosomal protein S18 acetylase RimI-like enzyme